MMHDEMPIGDTVSASRVFGDIDATIAEHFGGGGETLEFTIGRDTKSMTRDEADAWVAEARADGCSLVRYNVSRSGRNSLTVNLAAIEPLVG
jgi:hypothetical protein